MSNQNILREDQASIVILTINRPEVLNALNLETLVELHTMLNQVAVDEQKSVVIITGAGERAFIAGADISYMQDLSPLEAREFARMGHDVMRTIEELKQPVIAAINGFALGGGCELALSCDIRYCSDNAKFGQPEVGLGVIPGFGGTQRLPRLIGKGHAAELVYSGKMIDATEALRIGLVNHLFSQEELLDQCINLAKQIASKTGAVRLSKEAIRNGMEMDLGRACQYETELFSLCFSSSEQKEAMEAFLNKNR